MTCADQEHRLEGDVQVDDAYLGGERLGVVGRGSPKKTPIVAAVSLRSYGSSVFVKMSPLSSFTQEAVKDWVLANLAPGTNVLSDGLVCFSGVVDAGCAHSYIVVGKRKPRETPNMSWMNTGLDVDAMRFPPRSDNKNRAHPET